MDVNQQKLRLLAAKTDEAFELYKQNPASEDYARIYENAKIALDHYMVDMRTTIQRRAKK